jgi:hypothetical protein
LIQVHIVLLINENLFADKRDKLTQEIFSNDSKNSNKSDKKELINVNEKSVLMNNENSSTTSIIFSQIEIDEDVTKNLNILIDLIKDENLNELIDATIKCVIKF